ncbi:MAG: TetR/AcrR family transcriptional regulator [Acidimicrobiales bacterium]
MEAGGGVPPSQSRTATTRKAARTQAKLLAAGIELFASRGYEAAGLRDIEAHAGLQRGLITYHFGTKEEFWKSCMNELFARMTTDMPAGPEAAPDAEPAEAIRSLIGHYLRSSAENPDLMCIMLDEGRRDEWRLDWMVETHVRSFYEAVRTIFENARRHLAVREISAVQFYYLLVSSASIFAMAPECRLLSGTDPTGPGMVDAHVELIVSLLMAPGTAGTEPTTANQGGRAE